ncbi:DMT family transporter [Pollutibacter soli]|uniref:DMT family transporter n=1 Tax=Pollutibacter soli TaxID=3034157 RepID=UPI003013520C
MTYFKLTLVALFWGGTLIATRVAAQVFEPFWGASLRYILALLFLIPLALHFNKNFFKIGLKTFIQVSLLGFTGIAAYNYFFFKGLQLVPASHGALLIALNPVLVMLLSAWLYHEKIGGLKAPGIILSLCGVVFVISRGHITGLFSQFEKGDLYMLFCPIAWAIYTLAIRNVMKKVSAVSAATWATLTGCVMLLIFTTTETFPKVVPGKVWIALVYLALFGTVLGFIWYFDAIQKIGATKAAVFNYLIPVFALLLSVVILKEDVHWYTWIGALLVVAGIVLINIHPRHIAKLSNS